ncbi:MAG: hypothetical protein HS115_18575 [Spirochaetales bacterium]|nr:hypothetical protein [Spirochaetales bacterium]
MIKESRLLPLCLLIVATLPAGLAAEMELGMTAGGGYYRPGFLQRAKHDEFYEFSGAWVKVRPTSISYSGAGLYLRYSQELPTVKIFAQAEYEGLPPSIGFSSVAAGLDYFREGQNTSAQFHRGNLRLGLEKSLGIFFIAPFVGYEGSAGSLTHGAPLLGVGGKQFVDRSYRMEAQQRGTIVGLDLGFTFENQTRIHLRLEGLPLVSGKRNYRAAAYHYRFISYQDGQGKEQESFELERVEASRVSAQTRDATGRVALGFRARLDEGLMLVLGAVYAYSTEVDYNRLHVFDSMNRTFRNEGGQLQAGNLNRDLDTVLLEQLTDRTIYGRSTHTEHGYFYLGIASHWAEL